MNARSLRTAGTLVAGDMGLLAMDESNPTCNIRKRTWPRVPRPTASRAIWQAATNFRRDGRN